VETVEYTGNTVAREARDEGQIGLALMRVEEAAHQVDELVHKLADRIERVLVPEDSLMNAIPSDGMTRPSSSIAVALEADGDHLMRVAAFVESLIARVDL
jgi:hypothetical protein